jgi:hypothetical protein
MAFCYVLMSAQGVRFQKTCLYEKKDGIRERRDLHAEPLYSAAMECAEAMLASDAPFSQIHAVYSASAEYAAIVSLMGPDGSLDGIVLTEPLLFEYGC